MASPAHSAMSDRPWVNTLISRGFTSRDEKHTQEKCLNANANQQVTTSTPNRKQQRQTETAKGIRKEEECRYVHIASDEDFTSSTAASLLGSDCCRDHCPPAA